jgi:hypothetical protein
MHAVVQPIFEGLVVFAWCLVAGQISDRPQAAPDPNVVAAKKAERIMRGLQGAVLINDAERYLNQFAADQRDELRPTVTGVLSTPPKYQLAMKFKVEGVEASSYEAKVRVKILITNRCNSKYEESLETATLTIAPRAESDAGRFYSKPSGNPAEQDWEITKWETESVVPYNRERDR